MSLMALQEKNYSNSERILSLIERHLNWIHQNERIQEYEPNGPIEKLIRLDKQEPSIVEEVIAFATIIKSCTLHCQRRKHFVCYCRVPLGEGEAQAGGEP